MSGIEVAPGVFMQEGEAYLTKLGRWKRFKQLFGFGIAYGYPLCCVLRFAWTDARRDGKIISIKDAQAVRRGVVDRGDKNQFVPCLVFHKPTRKCRHR